MHPKPPKLGYGGFGSYSAWKICYLQACFSSQSEHAYGEVTGRYAYFMATALP